MENRERPRGGGWMQGLLAALRQHRRPRGGARHLPLHPVHLVRVLLPEREEVEAPVLGDLPRLPTPFGTLLYTSPYFTQLSVEDRISALPLAIDLLKYNATVESYLEYDDKSARDVFRGDPTNGRLGASEALYEQFLAPILCALMFAPPEELSASAALDVLYGYVLAHQVSLFLIFVWAIRMTWFFVYRTTSTCAGAKGPSRRRSSRRG